MFKEFNAGANAPKKTFSKFKPGNIEKKSIELAIYDDKDFDIKFN